MCAGLEYPSRLGCTPLLPGAAPARLALHQLPFPAKLPACQLGLTPQRYFILRVCERRGEVLN